MQHSQCNRHVLDLVDLLGSREREGATMGSRDALSKYGREAMNRKVQVAARCPLCFRKCIRTDCANCPRIVAGPFAGLYELPTYYSWAVES